MDAYPTYIDGSDESLSPDNPFPGPNPFGIGDEAYFWGRSREVRSLYSLVVSHRVVLVYAQSGAGKTSVLNAGLLPQLRGEFQILPVARVRGELPPELQRQDVRNIYVFHALWSWSEVDADPRTLTQTLREYLAVSPRDYTEDGLMRPRLIIFDQFEELFTAYPEEWSRRREFMEQLADMLESDDLLRVVLVVREDFVARLDGYADLLPRKVMARFRLERLRRTEAIEAATKPLENTRRRFGDGVAEQLVDELRKENVTHDDGITEAVMGEFVEPVHLQVVCAELWQGLAPHEDIIREDHVRTAGNVDQALRKFYDRVIRNTAQEFRQSSVRLRAWVDKYLITSDRTRGTVFAGREKAGDLDIEVVEYMAKEHLLRAEDRSNARWYELTHDRLLRPVLSSNEEHGASVTKIRLQRRLASVVLFMLAVALLTAWNQERLNRALNASLLGSAALQSLETDPEFARMLALAGRREYDHPVAQLALEQWANTQLRAVRGVGSGYGVNVKFDPTGKYAVTASMDSVRMWGLPDWRTISSAAWNDFVEPAVIGFSPKGTFFWRSVYVDTDSGPVGGEVLVSRVPDVSRAIRTLRADSAPISVVRFDPAERFVISGSSNAFTVWRVPAEDSVALQPIATICESGGVIDVQPAFSPDGSLLLCIVRDAAYASVLDFGPSRAAAAITRSRTRRLYTYELTVWSTETWERVRTVPLGQSYWLNGGLEVSNRHVLSALSDGTPIIHQTDTWARVPVPFVDSIAPIFYSYANASSRLVLIYRAEVDSTGVPPAGAVLDPVRHPADFTPITVWDLETGDVRHFRIRGHIANLKISPQGDRLVTVDEDAGAVRSWRIPESSADSLMPDLVLKTGNEGLLAGVWYSPDGRTIVSSTGTKMHIWDAEPRPCRQCRDDQLFAYLDSIYRNERLPSELRDSILKRKK